MTSAIVSVRTRSKLETCACYLPCRVCGGSSTLIFVLQDGTQCCGVCKDKQHATSGTGGAR